MEERSSAMPYSRTQQHWQLLGGMMQSSRGAANEFIIMMLYYGFCFIQSVCGNSRQQ